jgi:pyrroloquinoline-quinone synthase
MNTDAMKQVVEAQHLLKHPFYQQWNMGTLSQETLQEYATQYYHHVAAFPRYVSAVHSRCELADVRAALLENLIEEEQGPNNHPELWLRFCEGLGLKREDVLASTPAPATRALIETFFGLTSRSWQEGLAALYAYESQVPEVAKTKMEGLSKFYGVTSPRSLSFFQAHLTADVYHRQSEEQIFEKHVGVDREEAVLAASKSAGKALWGFMDSMLPAPMAA